MSPAILQNRRYSHYLKEKNIIHLHLFPFRKRIGIHSYYLKAGKFYLTYLTQHSYSAKATSTLHLICGQSVKSMNITSCEVRSGKLWSILPRSCCAELRDVGTQVRMKIPAAIWGDPIEQQSCSIIFSRLVLSWSHQTSPNEVRTQIISRYL